MNFSHLPSPGVINCGHELRKVATKAISAAEIRMDQSGLPSPQLVAFFQASLAATPGYTEPPVLPPGSIAVKNGDSIPMKDAAGTVQDTGVMVIDKGAIVGVRANDNVAFVKNGASTVKVTGTGTKATFVVVNGELTEIKLAE